MGNATPKCRHRLPSHLHKRAGRLARAIEEVFPEPAFGERVSRKEPPMLCVGRNEDVELTPSLRAPAPRGAADCRLIGEERPAISGAATSYPKPAILPNQLEQPSTVTTRPLMTSSTQTRCLEQQIAQNKKRPTEKTQEGPSF